MAVTNITGPLARYHERVEGKTMDLEKNGSQDVPNLLFVIRMSLIGCSPTLLGATLICGPTVRVDPKRDFFVGGAIANRNWNPILRVTRSRGCSRRLRNLGEQEQILFDCDRTAT
jgi:hypothetical protein